MIRRLVRPISRVYKDFEASSQRQGTLLDVVMRDAFTIHQFLSSTSPILKELIRRARSDPQSQDLQLRQREHDCQSASAHSPTTGRQQLHRPAKPDYQSGRVAARYESPRSVPPRSHLSPHLHFWKPAASRIRALLPSAVFVYLRTAAAYQELKRRYGRVPSEAQLSSEQLSLYSSYTRPFIYADNVRDHRGIHSLTVRNRARRSNTTEYSHGHVSEPTEQRPRWPAGRQQVTKRKAG